MKVLLLVAEARFLFVGARFSLPGLGVCLLESCFCSLRPGVGRWGPVCLLRPGLLARAKF